MIAAWVEHPLHQVFRRDEPPADAPNSIVLSAIRNEFECAQIVVRSQQRLDGLKVDISDLTSDTSRIESKQFRWNLVGYVPLRRNTPKTPPSELARQAPASFPDPLLEKDSFSLAPNLNQPIWLTFRIPPDTLPGEYRGVVKILLPEQAAEESIEVPVVLTVFNAILPDERHFGFTSWFSPGDLAKQHGVQVWSEDFWKLLPAYAGNLAEHRQTMILTPMRLIQVTRERNGSLTLDFSRFDRWASVFFDAGVQTLEGKEMGHRVGKWTSPVMRFYRVPVNDRMQGRPPLANEVVLRTFFAALEKHLDAKGWLSRFVMHVSDEPTRYNVESWRKMSRFIHAAAPRLRRIEANQTTMLDHDVEISVPQLDSLAPALDKYLAKRAKHGNELWFYTCMYPNGTYANRFVDYPLIKTRILPWIAARYGLTGYLHWGFNYWSAQPFENAERSGLPPGDSFVVYPGKDKPLNSLRWEMFREGIEDYECLWMLKKLGVDTTPIVSELILSPDRYDLSLGHFDALHRQIREQLHKPM